MVNKWLTITVHPNKIKARTAKAVLINMPNDSGWKGYAFWHPLSMTKENGKMLDVRFPETWEFTIRKKDKEDCLDGELMVGYWSD